MTKPKRKTIGIYPGERIIAVVPDRCSGPGWSNAPTWVYIEQADGMLRTECIQPSERGPDLQALFAAGLAICEAMINSVPVRNEK